MAMSKDLAVEPLRFGWREISLVGICLAMLALFFSRAPIAVDPIYHNFADRRTFCGVPNMFDVGSNIAFLIVGVAGVLFWRARRSDGFSVSWLVLFAGTALVFFGSGYYHWGPNNSTLLWDR